MDLHRLLQGYLYLFPILLHNEQTGCGPTRLPSQWVPGIKQPGREADHSPTSIADVKFGGVVLPLPQMSSWNGAYLIMHKEKFTVLPLQYEIQPRPALLKL
jgi:hypothetical protein